LFKALIDSGATTNFIALRLISPLSLIPAFALTSGIDSLEGKELVPAGQAKAYSLTFSLDSSPYTELFVGVPCSDYDLVLGLSWLRKYNPDINWKEGTFTPRLIAQSSVAVPSQGATAQSLVAVPAQGATALTPEQTMSHQDDEDPELWPLNVNSQDYADLPDDLHASEVYKQRLATEKITFAGTIDENRPAPLLPDYLRDFADVFFKENAFQLPPRRSGVDHAINLESDTTPPNRPVFRQSEAEIKALKGYLEEFQKCGFIRKSTSPCASPTLYVPKPGTKDLRLCVDYRGLNAITIKNRYPLPLIDSLLDGARKAKFYTKLDLRNAYHLIRIKEGDEWKTAFKTIFGLFEYLVMPFGLTNASASFQAYIDSVLEGMNRDQAMAFLDDILIMGETREKL